MHLRWGVLPLLSKTGRQFHVVSKQESASSLKVNSRTVVVIYDLKPTEDVAPIRREQDHYIFLITSLHTCGLLGKTIDFTQPSLQSQWVTAKPSSLGRGSSKLLFKGLPFLLRWGEQGGRAEEERLLRLHQQQRRTCLFCVGLYPSCKETGCERSWPDRWHLLYFQFNESQDKKKHLPNCPHKIKYISKICCLFLLHSHGFLFLG